MSWNVWLSMCFHACVNRLLCSAEGQSCTKAYFIGRLIHLFTSVLQYCNLDLYWFDFCMLGWKMLPIDVLLKIVVFPKSCLTYWWTILDDCSITSGFVYAFVCNVSWCSLCFCSNLPRQHKNEKSARLIKKCASVSTKTRLLPQDIKMSYKFENLIHLWAWLHINVSSVFYFIKDCPSLTPVNASWEVLAHTIKGIFIPVLFEFDGDFKPVYLH